MEIRPRKNDHWDWELWEHSWWDAVGIWTGDLRVALLRLERGQVFFPYRLLMEWLR